MRRYFTSILIVGLFAGICRADSQPIIVVERFKQMDQTLNVDWIGRAVQQTLVTELSRTRLMDVQTASTTPKYRIDGSYQVIDKNVRITATIWDNENHSIGGLKATGAVNDLFVLQDQLAEQARRQLVAVVRPVEQVKSQAPEPTANAAPVNKPARAWNPDWLHPAGAARCAREHQQYTFYNQGFFPYYGGYFGYYGCYGYFHGGYILVNYSPTFGD